MAPRLVVVLPRLVVVGAVFVLATGTLTYAAQKQLTPPQPAPAAAAPAAPTKKLVPDVQRQAYVFAKGILEDHGFAWRVEGPVQGYAANTVAVQSPAPGTRVIDTGSPLIVLRLADNAAYKDNGTPENASPYRGTPIQLAASAPPAALARPKPVAKPKPAAQAKPAARPTPAAKPATAATPAPAAKPTPRPPAFVVPGAPTEPLDEMALPARARQLAAWVVAHPKPSDRAVQHWLYQHSWIVTGAEFGWWRGAEALRLLIEADRRAQRVWGIGARSEAVARAALAQVEAKSR